MIKRESNVYENLADFGPDWVATPGESITDLLEEKGWKQTDLAIRMGYSAKHINLLLKGHAPITEDTAIRLERVLGGTARYWLSLETQYRGLLAQRSALIALNADIQWLKELPLSDMKKFGWIRGFSDKSHQVLECLRYFGVADVRAWRAQYERPVAAYRASVNLIRSPAAVSSWFRYGERQAEELKLNTFDRDGFESALGLIKKLTCEQNPAVFIPALTAICSKVGVAVVVAPAPKGCPVSGAIKWLNTDRALIMLSLRGKTDDTLWFSFFHEAGHLLQHRKKITFLDVLGEDGLAPKEEQEADAFARDGLIPRKLYQEFISHRLFNEKQILGFAKKLGIAPGIVVGRMQFDGDLDKNKMNHLKAKYTWRLKD